MLLTVMSFVTSNFLSSRINLWLRAPQQSMSSSLCNSLQQLHSVCRIRDHIQASQCLGPAYVWWSWVCPNSDQATMQSLEAFLVLSKLATNHNESWRSKTIHKVMRFIIEICRTISTPQGCNLHSFARIQLFAEGTSINQSSSHLT